MRLIDANALIEQIEINICKPCKERKEDYNGVYCRACGYGGEIEDIEDAPTIETQKWIPCSERLPDKDQICLVCGKKGGMCVARFWTDGKTNLWIKTGTGKFVYPIAWMPLPEPWRGEEDET